MPGLEVEYEKFLQRVEEDTADADWNIKNHPARKTLDRYSPRFGDWVRHLDNLLLLKQGGYPFDKNDLPLIEWRALAVLDKWKNRTGEKMN